MTLLELRNSMKKKKPAFKRQDHHKKRLKARWVRPKGRHSKVRLQKAGHQKKVSTGYGSPVEVKGLSKDGKKLVLVHNVADLEKVKKDAEKAVIGKTVGTKKKLSIVNKAKELGIVIQNIDTEKFTKKVEAILAEKKKKAADRKKKLDAKKEKKEKDKLEEKVDDKSDEEKKEAEKKEKDKLLTKREV